MYLISDILSIHWTNCAEAVLVIRQYRLLKARKEKKTSGFSAWNDIHKISGPGKVEVPKLMGRTASLKFTWDGPDYNSVSRKPEFNETILNFFFPNKYALYWKNKHVFRYKMYFMFKTEKMVSVTSYIPLRLFYGDCEHVTKLYEEWKVLQDVLWMFPY